MQNLDISKTEQTILDTQRKQRVLSVDIEFKRCKQNEIIDTGSNISCINFELIQNKKLLKPKDDIIITEANYNIIEQLDKINIEIK
jgi:hypothetical protein